MNSVILLLSLHAFGCMCQTQEFWMDFRLGFASPDGYDRPVIVTRLGTDDENDEHTYPGPELRVVEGRLVQIHVCNNLPTQAISIHWHGQHVEGYQWYDGVPFVTQCPIQAGSCFTYEWMPGPTGTYFWHGHMGAKSADGMAGPLIVEVDPNVSGPEPFTYDAEATIFLNDWWHTLGETQIAGLEVRNGFRWVGDPRSILINGKAVCPEGIAGTVDCDTAEEGRTEFAFQPNLKYRLRIISATSLSYLNFAIQGHQLEIVEADGSYVDPITVNSLDINSGQRYSVLVTPTTTGSFWMSARQIYRVNVQGSAIVRVGGDTNAPTPADPSDFAHLDAAVGNTEGLLASVLPPEPAGDSYDFSNWDPTAITQRQGPAPPTGEADVVLTYNTTQERIHGYLSWTLNNVAFVNRPHVPYLVELSEGDLDVQTSTGVDSRAQEFGITIEYLELGQTVDVVINNFPAGNGVSEEHPWHLHGGYFWVLGIGRGVYDDATDRQSLNFNNPVYRDSETVYPWGWLYLRFKADNPGVWLFHCHILWHLEMGMAAVFVVGEADDIPPHPDNFPVCGTKQDRVDDICPAVTGGGSGNTWSIYFNNYGSCSN